jgi:hypothetical protein
MDGRAALVVQNANFSAMNSHKDISKFSLAMLEGPVESSVA